MGAGFHYYRKQSTDPWGNSLEGKVLQKPNVALLWQKQLSINLCTSCTEHWLPCIAGYLLQDVYAANILGLCKDCLSLWSRGEENKSKCRKENESLISASCLSAIVKPQGPGTLTGSIVTQTLGKYSTDWGPPCCPVGLRGRDTDNIMKLMLLD